MAVCLQRVHSPSCWSDSVSQGLQVLAGSNVQKETEASGPSHQERSTRPVSVYQSEPAGEPCGCAPSVEMSKEE